jgi:hypothetical protein
MKKMAHINPILCAFGMLFYSSGHKAPEMHHKQANITQTARAGGRLACVADLVGASSLAAVKTSPKNACWCRERAGFKAAFPCTTHTHTSFLSSTCSTYKASKESMQKRSKKQPSPAPGCSLQIAQPNQITTAWKCAVSQNPAVLDQICFCRTHALLAAPRLLRDPRPARALAAYPTPPPSIASKAAPRTCEELCISPTALMSSRRNPGALALARATCERRQHRLRYCPPEGCIMDKAAVVPPTLPQQKSRPRRRKKKQGARRCALGP